MTDSDGGAVVFGARTAPWAGVAFALLMGASLIIISHAPGVRASDDAVNSFYAGSRLYPLQVTVLYLLPVAGVCFLWFVGVLRYRLRLVEGSRLGLVATVQYAAGVIFLALLFASGAGLGSGVAVKLSGAALPSAASLRQVLALSDAMLYIYASKAAAMFTLTTSVVGLRTGTLHRWLGCTGLLVAAVLMFATSLSLAFVLVFPGWVLVVSLYQLRRRHAGAPTLPGRPGS